MKQAIEITCILILPLLMNGCNEIFTEEPGATPVEVFENLWTTFEKEYALFEERNVDWQEAYNHYRPFITGNTSNSELYTTLTHLLAILNDGHVNLVAPDREVFFSNIYRREKTKNELFNLQIIKNNYLTKNYSEGKEESYIYGQIRNENIGYIYFGYIRKNFQKINEFLTRFESADGLIIDLRHNSGGDFTWSYPNLGRLTAKKKFIFRSKTKNGPEKSDYTNWKNWYIEPDGNFADLPVVVLTDRYTISAAERTVMAFKALPNVTLVGDTTNGAHGTMVGRELANGWYYSLVPQKIEMFDGKSYEGIGLAPDITVINELRDIEKGVDKALEKAISLLK